MEKTRFALRRLTFLVAAARLSRLLNVHIRSLVCMSFGCSNRTFLPSASCVTRGQPAAFASLLPSRSAFVGGITASNKIIAQLDYAVFFLRMCAYFHQVVRRSVRLIIAG